MVTLAPPSAAANATPLIAEFSTSAVSVPVKGTGALKTVSRDGNANTRLADGRSLWAYADTGYRRPDSSWGFVSSSAALASSSSPQTMNDRVTSNGSLTQFIAASTSSCSGGATSLYWPRSAARVGSGTAEDVYVFYEHVCNGVGQRTGVARYRVASSGAIRGTVLNASIFGAGNQPGSAAATKPGDGYLYVFWSAGANLRVGRVTPTSAGSAGAYRYWTGSTWAANSSSAVGISFACCHKPSIQWIDQLAKWVMVDYAGPYGSAGDANRGRAVLTFADNPQGPWGSRQYVDLPGCNRSGSSNPTSSDCRAVEIVPSASSAASIGIAYHNPRVDSGLNVSGFADGQTQLTRARLSPLGTLEKAIVSANGTLQLIGWAIEPENDGAVALTMTIDGGSPVSIGSAATTRTDVAARYPGRGSGHGYDVSGIVLTPGSHTVCVTATNSGLGTDTRLGCRAVWTPAALTTVPPRRVLDTRTGGSRVAAGGYVDVTIAGAWGVPAGATGAVLNVTATSATGSGYLTAYPSGRPRSSTSVVNFDTSGASATLATVGLDSTRKVRLYAGVRSTHVVVDLMGYYTASGAATSGRTLATAPKRVFDSRNTTRFRAGETRTVQIAGVAGVPSSGAAAVVVNLTMTKPSASAYASVWAGGAARPSPLTSNLNVSSGDTRSNQVIAPLGVGGAIAIRPSQASDLIVDVVGYVTSSGAPVGTAGRFVAIEPARFLDTRSGARRAAGSDVALTIGGRGSVPSGAAGVVGTLTAVGATGSTYVTAYPYGQSRPYVSNVNITRASQVRPNHVVSGLGSNRFRLFNAESGHATHLLFDTSGWLTP